MGVLVCGIGDLLLRSAANMPNGLSPHLSNWPFWLLGVVLLTLFIQAVLAAARPKPDPLLFPMTMFLVSVGVVMIARLKPDLLVPQLRWLVIGLLVLLVMLRLNNYVGKLCRYQYIWGILCIVVLSMAILFGTEIGGSRNWLVIGSFRVQPSEFGKILLVLFLASYLSDHNSVLTETKNKILGFSLPQLRFIAPLAAIWGISLLMFVLQRDLGSALLFFGIAILMTYMATNNLFYLLSALLFFAVSAVASYFMFGHVQNRFDIWLNPWADPTGGAYQVIQSMFAFASGGVWGVGFGEGQPSLIPEVHTDFIYAAAAEEFGLIGSLTILIVYALFFYEGLKIAISLNSADKILLAGGISVVFFLQSFIIIAGVTKFLPLTGITLPFISYGGSSMVSCFTMLGMLLALSRK